MRVKKIIVAAMVTAAVLFAVASAFTEGGQEAAEEKVMHLTLVQEQKGLTAWAAGQAIISPDGLEEALPFDTLLLWTPDGSEVIPNLAESWDVSADNLAFTFHLRDDVLFHDGEKMHADDVEASFYQAAGSSKSADTTAKEFSQLKGVAAYAAGEGDRIDGIEVLNDYTIRFTLTKPSFDFLRNICNLKIFPRHLIWEDLQENRALFFQSQFWQMPIGTGPFMFNRRVPGDFDELVAFEDYFKGRPKIDKVMLWDRSPVLAAEDGKLSIKWIKDPEMIKQLMDIEGMVSYPVKNPVYKRALWCNMDDPLMQDVRVRKAIAYAIDRETICEEFFDGLAAPWHTVMSPVYWANWDLPKIPYDPERSKQLLREANWDTSTELTMVYYYATKEAEDFMALIQSYLSEVGIIAKPRLLERDVGPILHDKTSPWQLAFGARNKTDVTLLLQYTTGFNISIAEYSNPTVDRMVQEMLDELDATKREELANRIEEIIMEDMPSIPLYHTKDYIFMTENFRQTVKYLNRFHSPHDMKLHEWDIVQ